MKNDLKTITLFATLVLILLISCKDINEEIEINCGIYDSYTVHFPASASSADIESESWAFLSDSLGNIIDVKNISIGREVTLEDNSGCYQNYNVTTLKVFRQSQDGRKIFTFTTYVNVPSNHIFKPVGSGGGEQSKGPFNFSITNLDTLNGLVTTPSFYLLPLKIEKGNLPGVYDIKNVSSSNNSIFIKIKGNNESFFRYALYKNTTERFNADLDYKALPIVDDKLEVNMHKDGRWIINCAGLYDEDYNNRIYLKEFDSHVLTGTKFSSEIPTELNKFFVNIQGNPSDNLFSTFYFKGIFNQKIINLEEDEYEIQVNQRTTDELNLKGIGSADIMRISWLLDSNNERVFSWNVIGSFKEIKLIRPEIPAEIFNRFQEFDNVSLKAQGGISTYFYEDIEGYENYLKVSTSGDPFWEYKNKMRNYYKLF